MFSGWNYSACIHSSHMLAYGAPRKLVGPSPIVTETLNTDAHRNWCEWLPLNGHFYYTEIDGMISAGKV